MNETNSLTTQNNNARIDRTPTLVLSICCYPSPSITYTIKSVNTTLKGITQLIRS